MSKWFSTILLSIILLMLVVGVVNAAAELGSMPPANEPKTEEGEELGSSPGTSDSGTEEGEEIGAGEGGASDLPGKSGETVPGTLIPGTGDKASDKNNAPPGKPPVEVPEFSTIGMLAAGATAGLGYMFMRRKRK
jgi:hypothetical protein